MKENLIAFLVGSLIALGLWFLYSSRHIDRVGLEERNGIYYKDNKTKLYTGIAYEYYTWRDTKSKDYRFTFKNGILVEELNYDSHEKVTYNNGVIAKTEYYKEKNWISDGPEIIGTVVVIFGIIFILIMAISFTGQITMGIFRLLFEKFRR